MDSLLTDVSAGYSFSSNNNQVMVGQMARDFAEKNMPIRNGMGRGTNFPGRTIQEIG
jgi:hypothetical protein